MPPKAGGGKTIDVPILDVAPIMLASSPNEIVIGTAVIAS
jgi:hypothetical protein